EGRAEESLGPLEHALESPLIEPRHRARLLVMTARTQRNLGRIDAAGRVANEALDAATAAGDRWATAWALAGSTLVHGMRGETAHALALCDQALATAEGDPALTDLRLMLRGNRAHLLGNLDRYDDAIDDAEQARRMADDAGNVMRQALARMLLTELL